MKRFVLMICLWLVGVAQANQPEYPVITPENVMNLQEVEVLGTGAMNPAVAWTEDGSIVVGGARGLYLYTDLQSEPQFIELGVNVQWLLFAGETLFFSDDTSLYAYDLANQRLVYLLEGQKPLAVSQSGTLLAYEVDMGVRVLEIATGEVLYNLDYAALGWDEATEEVDGYYQEYRFYDAQFFADDSEIVVTWMYIYHGGWEGRSDTGTQFWRLDDLSWMDITDYVGRGAHSGFMGMDSEDQPIRDTTFELEDGCRAIYTFDFEIRSIVAANLFAVACETGGYGSGENHTGIWDWQTGKQIAILPEIGRMQFSPDLSQIAIDTKIFDVATGQNLANLQTNTYEFFGENILEYSHDNRLRLLDANSYEEIAVLPIRPDDLLKREDEVFIHENGREAYWIDNASGQSFAHFEAETPILTELTAWDFSESGTFVLSHDFNRDEIYLWNVATGQILLSEDYRILHPVFYEDAYLLVYKDDEISLLNPVDESTAWSFSYDESFTALRLESDYLFIFGSSIEIYARATGALVLSLPNTYGDPGYLAWSGDRLAYYDGNDILISSFPDGELVQRIQTDVYGYLEFYDSTTLIIRDEFSDMPTFYEIESGEIIQDPLPVPNEQACIETESLNFFCTGTLRIEDKAGQTLMQIPTASAPVELSLSSDESRLLILYPGHYISVWAVPQ